MWMEALCERQAVSFLKRKFFCQSGPLGSNHSHTRLHYTKVKESQNQPIEGQDITVTLDTNFCSCCHEYRTKKTTTISRYFFIRSSITFTLLIILSLLTNSSYANAQPTPVTTGLTQTLDPGISTSAILSRKDKVGFVENQPQARTIPGAPYYEFFINEASYKFWAVFQLTTVFILLYSAFAAIYYAKYTFLTEIETLKDEDIILRRRRQLRSNTAMQIIAATTSLPPPLLPPPLLPPPHRRSPGRGRH